MGGVGAVDPGSQLLSGVIYSPYYLGTFVVAAGVIWGCPQTWDWTRTITAPKAIAILGLFTLAVLALTTQAFNPFIYFIF
jgi:alginate O-acetyltransferase complex protein AlgI